MTPEQLELVRALRAASARRELSTHDLAARTGYSERQVRRVLHGSSWSLSVVVRLARVLRTSLPPELVAQLESVVDLAKGSGRHARSLAPVAAARPPWARAVPASWLVLARPERGTVVLLHEDAGAWVEVDEAELLSLDDRRASALGRVLGRPAVGGRHHLELSDLAGGGGRLLPQAPTTGADASDYGRLSPSPYEGP